MPSTIRRECVHPHWLCRTDESHKANSCCLEYYENSKTVCRRVHRLLLTFFLTGEIYFLFFFTTGITHFAPFDDPSREREALHNCSFEFDEEIPFGFFYEFRWNLHFPFFLLKCERMTWMRSKILCKMSHNYDRWVFMMMDRRNYQ